MTELDRYWKRVYELPGIVRRPEDAKLNALRDAGVLMVPRSVTITRSRTLLSSFRFNISITLLRSLEFFPPKSLISSTTLLLSASRAELAVRGKNSIETLQQHRLKWSDNLASFMA